MSQTWRMVVTAAVVLGLAPMLRAADQEIVKLTIDEESGVGRVAEPMTMGVPFPKGLVTNLERVGVKDETGASLACQWSKAANWVGDPSVKWAHFTTPITIPAKGRKVLTVLLSDVPLPLPQTPLKAEVKENVATVVTGPVKFTVRGARFNGFDAAWFDPTGRGDFSDATQVLAGGDRGASEVKGDTTDKTAFSSLNDPDGKVEIERQGPMEVVVKAAGEHRAADGKRFNYIVRFYAYANSPVVRVAHTFENRQGVKPADCLTMTALNLVLPTTLAGGRVAIGGEKEPYVLDGPAAITQVDSDKFVVTSGDKQVGAGQGRSTKPLTTGWIDVTKGGRGVAVGVKWFWQTYPKALRCSADGTLSVGLYQTCADEATPPWHRVPFDVYMGQSRTHYLTVRFHGAEPTTALNDFFAGTQRPLMAWAPPKYYCRDTHAFGYAAENDPTLYGDKWPLVDTYNRRLEAAIDRILKKRDGARYNRITRDSYGLYEWGDIYHWDWTDFDKSPKHTPEWMVSWEGNYYDFPNAALMQFARTGNRKYLDAFFPSALHVGDVFTCHYHPRPELIGACRYCPPRNHVATDDGAPYVSAEFNHNKSQCVFNHYYLTGDLRTLENALLLANNALTNHDADRGWAARGVGHQIAALWCSYELTGDPKYLARMKDMAYRAMAEWKTGKYRSGGFHDGIANEGLAYYYWVTRDPQAIAALSAGLDIRGARAGNETVMALGNAMTYAATGQAKYADVGWRAFARGADDIARPKTFGLAWRNTAYALYFLATDLAEFKRDAPPAEK
jgi:hypothetical protein